VTELAFYRSLTEDAWSEADHDRDQVGRFASVGLRQPDKSAPPEFHSAFESAFSGASKIEAEGLRLTRAQRSNISPSTYMSFSKPDNRGFEISKKGRGLYAREHGNFPSMGNFNVRVSNHLGYGEGTEVHKSIRTDKKDTGEASAVAAARRLMELEKSHPPGGLPTHDDHMAFDRSQLDGRWKDEDGRLHVDGCKISKACVNPYRGSEVPRYRELGLDPSKIYQFLRDPDELTKGAPTFHGLQLMSTHTAVDSENPEALLVAGTIGTNPRFEAPHLVNDVVIWLKEDVQDIENKKKRELSCGYYWDADMTPGTYEGAPYDGVMRNIRANHVALVKAGRAGPDVMVHDTMENVMPLASRKAIMVKGALAALLRPNLLPGTVLALDSALGSVNRLNWKTQKPVVLATIEAMTKPSLKAGVSFDALRAAFDEAEEEDDETEAEDETEEMSAEEEAAETLAREREEKEGMSAAERVAAALARKGAREKLRAKDKKAADKKAMDASRARDAEMEKWREAGKDRKALDKILGHKATDKEFEEWANEEMQEPNHADDGRGSRGMDKAAMDAAIKLAVDAAIATAETSTESKVIARMNATIQARQEVRPHVGEVALAFDTAEKVYAYALKAKKVPIDGVHPSAYRAMVGMIQKPTRERAAPMALDTASGGQLDDMFPMGAHINQL
jgi:hypothetical protein